MVITVSLMEVVRLLMRKQDVIHQELHAVQEMSVKVDLHVRVVSVAKKVERHALLEVIAALDIAALLYKEQFVRTILAVEKAVAN
jgi:hypothetical protein